MIDLCIFRVMLRKILTLKQSLKEQSLNRHKGYYKNQNNRKQSLFLTGQL